MTTATQLLVEFTDASRLSDIKDPLRRAVVASVILANVIGDAMNVQANLIQKSTEVIKRFNKLMNYLNDADTRVAPQAVTWIGSQERMQTTEYNEILKIFGEVGIRTDQYSANGSTTISMSKEAIQASIKKVQLATDNQDSITKQMNLLLQTLTGKYQTNVDQGSTFLKIAGDIFSGIATKMGMT